MGYIDLRGKNYPQIIGQHYNLAGNLLAPGGYANNLCNAGLEPDIRLNYFETDFIFWDKNTHNIVQKIINVWDLEHNAEQLNNDYLLVVGVGKKQGSKYVYLRSRIDLTYSVANNGNPVTNIFVAANPNLPLSTGNRFLLFTDNSTVTDAVVQVEDSNNYVDPLPVYALLEPFTLE